MAEYVRTTGDRGVLDERAPFLEAPLLAPDAQEAYGQPRVSVRGRHAVRTLRAGDRQGPHHRRARPAAHRQRRLERRHEPRRAGRPRRKHVAGLLPSQRPQRLRAALPRAERRRPRRPLRRTKRDGSPSQLEQSWDGEWYRRGYYDDGSPLGSAQNDECRIDSISQSWAVLSGAVPIRFAERAMDAVRTSLVARGSQMLLLLHPPFDRSAQEPGYIKGYPPGVRENGGQYTHAAVWIVMALAQLGSGDEAAEFFHMLNPVNHGRTPADVARYKTEPYVMAGDVYARPPHAGRGGWSWYTGSAGWMYRAGLESILGLRRRGETFVIDPCIPSSWPEYRITWRFLDSRYEITVSNPMRRCRGVATATLDGAPVDPGAIPLVNDGRTHEVQIVLGDHAPRQRDRQHPTMASERP